MKLVGMYEIASYQAGEKRIEAVVGIDEWGSRWLMQWDGNWVLIPVGAVWQRNYGTGPSILWSGFHTAETYGKTPGVGS